MKSPAFQLYVQDFLLGTMGMDDAEVGAYIRALCQQWDKDGLPDSADKIAKLSGSKRKNVEAVLHKFVKGDDEKLRNQRLEVEREKKNVFLSKSVEAGKKSGEARRAKSGKKAEPTLNQPSVLVPTKPEPNTNSSTSTPTSYTSTNVDASREVQPTFENPFVRKPVVPTLRDVEEVFFRNGKPEEAQRFFNWYDAKGWYTGNSPIMKWQSLVPDWISGKNRPDKPGLVADARIAAGKKLL